MNDYECVVNIESGKENENPYELWYWRLESKIWMKKEKQIRKFSNSVENWDIITTIKYFIMQKDLFTGLSKIVNVNKLVNGENTNCWSAQNAYLKWI